MSTSGGVGGRAPRGALLPDYITFYPNHFFHRLRSIASTTRRRHVLRPIPYVAGMLVLINLIRSVVSLSTDPVHGIPAWEFNLVIISGAALTPLLFIALTLVIIVFSLMIDMVFDEPHILINWRLLRLIRRSSFWRRYRFAGLLPALIYYSTNLLMTLPAAALLMLILHWIYGIWRPVLGVSLGLVVLLLDLGLVYSILYRPLLFAMLAPSVLCRRMRAFPELMSCPGYTF